MGRSKGSKQNKKVKKLIGNMDILRDEEALDKAIKTVSKITGINPVSGNGLSRNDMRDALNMISRGKRLNDLEKVVNSPESEECLINITSADIIGTEYTPINKDSDDESDELLIQMKKRNADNSRRISSNLEEENNSLETNENKINKKMGPEELMARKSHNPLLYRERLREKLKNKKESKS